MRNNPPIEHPSQGEFWRHCERGGTYVIVGVADRETGIARVENGSRVRAMTEPGWDVVYGNFIRGPGDEVQIRSLHTRCLFEFMDGRFEKV